MEIYVLQLHILHDGTYTEGATLSQTVAENWVAELPYEYSADAHSQPPEWRSYEVFTPMELTDED